MTDAELIARLRDADLYNAQHYERDPLHKQAADRIEALTAKLAQAVEALDEAVYLLDPDEKDMMRQAGVYRIVTTLAEIKGESHD